MERIKVTPDKGIGSFAHGSPIVVLPLVFIQMGLILSGCSPRILVSIASSPVTSSSESITSSGSISSNQTDCIKNSILWGAAGDGDCWKKFVAAGLNWQAFTTTGSMLQSREYHEVTLLLNGKVLVT